MNMLCRHGFCGVQGPGPNLGGMMHGGSLSNPRPQIRMSSNAEARAMESVRDQNGDVTVTSDSVRGSWIFVTTSEGAGFK